MKTTMFIRAEEMRGKKERHHVEKGVQVMIERTTERIGKTLITGGEEMSRTVVGGEGIEAVVQAISSKDAHFYLPVL